MNKNILDIPKIKQIKNNFCGVAAACMFASLVGKNISQEEIVDYFGYPHRIAEYGVEYWEVTEVVQKLGLRFDFFGDLTLQDIKYSIDEGSPLLAVCFHEDIEREHFYVIKGYDIKKNKIFVNDPSDLKLNDFDYNFFKKIDTKRSLEISKAKPKSKKPSLISAEEFF